MSSLIWPAQASDPAPWATATMEPRGEVAQLVEHTTENRGVAGSIPALAILGSPCIRRSFSADVGRRKFGPRRHVRGRGPFQVLNPPPSAQISAVLRLDRARRSSYGRDARR